MATFCSFCELEHRVVIALVKSLCAFIFYESCFWSGLQIPIQRRRCIKTHLYSSFKCDAYRSAVPVIVFPTMFNAVKPVDALMHVSPARDFFRLFKLQLFLFHVALVLLLFNRERKAQRKNQMGKFAPCQP